MYSELQVEQVRTCPGRKPDPRTEGERTLWTEDHMGILYGDHSVLLVFAPSEQSVSWGNREFEVWGIL